MATTNTDLYIKRAALADILGQEIALYSATHSAQWQLSCYGVSEDAVLAPHLPALAGIVDSISEAAGTAGASASLSCSAASPAACDMEMTSRRACYTGLLSLHRYLLAGLYAIMETLKEDQKLLSVIAEVIEIHIRLSARLSFFAVGGHACPVAEQDETQMLFI